LNLIIEVDGASHEVEEVGHYDRVRQQNLEENGYYVLRFRDEEIFKELESIIQSIDYKIASLKGAY
jgi:very-short-patch-repair endonuclease